MNYLFKDVFRELLIDFHKNAKRQGPGNSFVILKAFKLIDLNQKLE